MDKIKKIYKKNPFTYSLFAIVLVLIPILFLIREKSNIISERIAQTATCDAQTIACDPQFQENKTAACGAFKSAALDNLLSRDDSSCKGMDRAFVEEELDKACAQGCIKVTSAPTNTPTLTPVSTSTPSITKGITQAPSQTPTPTRNSSPTTTPMPTSIPSVTLVPSTTTGPGVTTISFSLKYPGIGHGLAENVVPNTKVQSIIIALQNSSRQNVKPYTSQGNFENGVYKGTFAVNESGKYLLTLKMENTREVSSEVVDLVPGTTIVLPQLTLAPGDLDHNNTLDLYDFNILVGCYGEKTCNEKKLADLNDDGAVNSKDLNILLRSFALRNN